MFLDVSDVVVYNLELLNYNNSSCSFFHLNRNDPTIGFPFDLTSFVGCTYPESPFTSSSFISSIASSPEAGGIGDLTLRLVLASHLAQHLRHLLEEQTSFTATVGISTNKLLSKLVGNVNKPNSQTTLVPPYIRAFDDIDSNVTAFVDAHDIGRIPGIGFKLAQKIRKHVLGREADFDAGLVYGGSKEKVHVRDVRLLANMGPELLDRILGGPGSPQGIGARIWSLLNGVDDTEVGKARSVPRQISIEDSYIRLDSINDVKKELKTLGKSLVRRLQLDLTEYEDEEDILSNDEGGSELRKVGPIQSKRWMAFPQTLRLTTRPRLPMNPDGTRTRSFNRICRSSRMPSFVFSLVQSIDDLVEKLVNDFLIPMFHKLHPEHSGWNLSLVNIAATNMVETATNSKESAGRDIGKMFKRQEDVLKEWRFDDVISGPWDDKGVVQEHTSQINVATESEPIENRSRNSRLQEPWVYEDGVSSWNGEDDMPDGDAECKLCGAKMFRFAMSAHEQWHSQF